MVLFPALQMSGQEEKKKISDEEKQKIALEIRNRLDGYGEALKNKDKGIRMNAAEALGKIANALHNLKATDMTLSAEEAKRLFGEIPEALSNSVALAEACDLDLTGGPAILPRFPLPRGETAYSWLHRLAQEGLRRRYGAAITPEVTGVVRERQNAKRGLSQSGFMNAFGSSFVVL